MSWKPGAPCSKAPGRNCWRTTAYGRRIWGFETTFASSVRKGATCSLQGNRICLAAGSEHLPLKGGGRPGQVGCFRLGPNYIRRNRQEPISVGGREGVAIPTPSLPFSRGGRRSLLASGQTPLTQCQRRQ